MDELIAIIEQYESDTFSASNSEITHDEATVMAHSLFQSLVKIVSEGGQLQCDGDVLDSLLYDLREEAEEALASR